MKRMMVRLSALSAVMSLGTFAVVQAQRSSHPADPAVEVASAEKEPAALVVDERTVKPLPTELPTAADRYAPDRSGETTTTAAVDPFMASSATAQAYDLPATDVNMPPVPESEDLQSIPPAAGDLRYSGNRPGPISRTAMRRDTDVRPLGYEDTGAAQDIPPAGDVPLAAPGQGEPTLAPPREGFTPYAERATPEPAAAPEGFADPANAPTTEPADANFAPVEPRAPGGANRYGRGVATADRTGRSTALARSREPALLPDEPLDEKQALAPSGEDNFAPAAAENFTAPQRMPGVAAAEGGGRPGGKHLEGPQAPHLTVEKIAPAEVQVGKPAVFVLKIRNTGPIPAAQVEVHDQVPKGAQLLSTTPKANENEAGEIHWSLGTIKPGEEATAEMELMPVAEGEIGSVATVHFAAETSVRTTVTKPVLTLEVKAPSEVMQGEDVTLSIKLSNSGTGAATGVVLREAVPELLQHAAGPELEYEVGTLRPGETRSLDLTMRAAKAGRVLNTITAVGEGSVRVDQQTEMEVIAPALALKMEGPARRYLDRQATYTVSISNPGTATAKEISLITHLPPGLKFVEANNAGHYDPRTRAVQWLLEELPPNETGSVTLVAVPVEPGEQLVRIESTADRGLSAQEEKTIVVEGVSAINFEVVDVADPIEVGGETAYEIRVVNQGTKAATNVQVVALLPEELKPTGGDGPARHAIDGQRVLFEPLAQLAPKADTTYRVKAQGRGPGDVRVRVQVLTDEIKAPVTKEESTRVYADE